MSKVFKLMLNKSTITILQASIMEVRILFLFVSVSGIISDDETFIHNTFLVLHSILVILRVDAHKKVGYKSLKY